MKYLILVSLAFMTVASLSSANENRPRDRRGYREQNCRDRRDHAEGTCRQLRTANGYDFYHTSADFGHSPLRKVWDGAVLRVIGYEQVFYNGWSEGVKFEVVENGNDPSGAGPGEILYTYASLFSCQ